MENSDKIQKNSKPRGKSAIDHAHREVTKEQEPRITLAISDLYEVDSSEAAEIHTNYHVEKILSKLKERANTLVVPGNILASKAESFEMHRFASQVANGEITEKVAVDSLYRRLSGDGTDGDVTGDRYINFYG